MSSSTTSECVNYQAWNQPPRTGEQGLRRLQDVSRDLEDSQALGANVMANLSDQREQLRTALRHGDEMHGNLLISRRLIDRMTTRAFMVKFMFCIFIGVLLLAIGLIIFFKWGPHGTPASSPPPP
ncbi:hypothetical protein AB1Y20_008399 [Prymnesium parvum]|uniref:V-SNARE coiled-coil homology domain-containing protein n=1 Tax=Prymnesium parvum TaxID=97485 RepID=A0AB34IRC5_PRYPA